MLHCPHCGSPYEKQSAQPFPCPDCGETISPASGIQIRLYDRVPLTVQSIGGVLTAPGANAAPMLTAVQERRLLFAPFEGGMGVAGTLDCGDAIEIPDSHDGLPVIAVLDGALRGTTIRMLRLPESVRILGREAFSECRQLTAITGGAGLISIGQDCFRGCTQLTDVHLDSRPEIHISAFSGCYALGIANEPAPPSESSPHRRKCR